VAGARLIAHMMFLASLVPLLLARPLLQAKSHVIPGGGRPPALGAAQL